MMYSEFCEAWGTLEDKTAQQIKSQHLALSMNVCHLQRCASSSSDVQPWSKAVCELNCSPLPLLCFCLLVGKQTHDDLLYILAVACLAFVIRE